MHSQLERCRSGRSGRTRHAVNGQLFRGFESLSLRKGQLGLRGFSFTEAFFLFVSILGLARKEAYKQKKWLKEPRNPVAKVCREARGNEGIGVTKRATARAVANSSLSPPQKTSLQTLCEERGMAFGLPNTNNPPQPLL